MRKSLYTAILLGSLYTIWANPACEHPIYCNGDLLDLVQRSNLFTDSKTFVDRPLNASPEVILSSFAASEPYLQNNISLLREFVFNWTLESKSDLLPWEPDDWSDRPAFISTIVDPQLRQWAYDLNDKWKNLGRRVAASVSAQPSYHSLLAVPFPFIVPGGRFGELYYWDTYWILEGLLLCEMQQTAQNMVLNLVSLVERYGMVPNGGRVYYTNRSQPPLLPQMVDLVYSVTGDRAFLQRVLPLLVREYQFWMDQRSVMVQGHLMNRYAVDTDTPRPESYREDLNTASHLPEEERHRLYTELTSAAESGMDFSSRWLSGSTLSSIHTKSIIPVDLNAILCQNEGTLAKLFREIGNNSAATVFDAAKVSRQLSFDTLFWNKTQGLWLDWNQDTGAHSNVFYSSSLVPLLWGCSHNISQHKQVLSYLTKAGFLHYPGGLPASLKKSGQQWDYPNVWAPHQWFPVLAWHQSDDQELQETAQIIAETWINSTYIGWEKFNHMMFEKYNCTEAGLPGGGGEYVIQAGFGWTNGVTLHFLSLFSTSTVSHDPELGWIAGIVIPVVLLIATVPCVLLLRWIHKTGEQRYKRRVQNTAIAEAETSTTSYDTFDDLDYNDDTRFF